MDFPGWQIEKEGLNYFVLIRGLRARQIDGNLFGPIRSVSANKSDELCVSEIYIVTYLLGHCQDIFLS